MTATFYLKGAKAAKLATVFLFVTVWVAACNLRPPSPARPTATPTARRTPTPATTPTAAALSPANVSYLEPITTLGRGVANSVTWSPAGKTLAVATSFGIDLYDAESYARTGFLDAQGAVHALAYSPDGTHLAAGLEGDIQLWDIAGERLVFTRTAHTGPIRALAFSPDSERLFSGAQDDSHVHVWDMESGQLLDSFTAGETGVRSLAVSKDGKLLLAATENKIGVYELTTGKLLYPEIIFEAQALFFGRDGQTFVAIGYEIANRTLLIYQEVINTWDIQTGKLLQKSITTNHQIYTAAASPAQQWFILGCDDGIRVWDAFTKKASQPLKGQSGRIGTVTSSPDGLKFATIQHTAETGGGTLSIWSFASQKIVHVFDEHTSIVTHATFGLGGHWAALSGQNRQVQVWDIASHKVIQRFEGFGPLALSPDGKVIAINEGRLSEGIYGHVEYTELRLRQMQTTEILPKGKISCDAPVTAIFSTSNQWLLSGGGSCPIVMRDIETGKILLRFGDSLALTEQSHSNLVLSKDEQFLALMGENAIEIWRLADKTLLFTLEQMEGSQSMALNADGRFLAVGGVGSIKVWDVGAQQLLFQLNTQLNAIHSLAFSPDGQLLAVGGKPLEGETANLEFWNAWNGAPLARFESRGGEIIQLEFSADGQQLLTASALGIVQAWDAHQAPIPSAGAQPSPTRRPTAMPTPTLGPTPSSGMVAIATLGLGEVSPVYRSPDGQIIAYMDAQTLHWVDANTYQELGAIEVKNDLAEAKIVFSPDSKRVAIEGTNAHVIDLDTGTVLGSVGAEVAMDIAFSPDGSWMVYRQPTYESSLLKIWNAETSEWPENAFTPLYPENNHFLCAPAISPNGNLVAVGDWDGRVYIWDASDGKRRFILEGHADGVNDVAFSPNGRYLASGSDDGTVRLWNVQTGQLAHLITGFTDSVYGVEFSPDNNQLLVDTSHLIQAWDLNAEQLQPYPTAIPTPDLFAAYLHQQGYVEASWYGTTVQFSPDGQTLAVANRSILLWDVASHSILQTLEGINNQELRRLAFNSDATRLAAVDESGCLLLWDTRNGKLLRSQDIPGLANTYAFSDDARYLAFPSKGGLVVWDVTHGSQLSQLPLVQESEQYPSAIWFSADGTRLYIVPETNSSVQTWDWRANVQVQNLDFPEAERAYVPDFRHSHLVRCIGYAEARCELWDLESQSSIKLSKAADDGQDYVFSPDGQFFVIFGEEELSFWGTQTGQLLYAIEQPFDLYPFPGRSISPDNSILAVSEADGRAQLWDIGGIAAQISQARPIPTGKPTITPYISTWLTPTAAPTPTLTPDRKENRALEISEVGHFGGGKLNALAWSADGQQIFAAGALGIEGYTSALTETLHRPANAPVSGLTALDDGRVLARQTDGEHLIVWDMASGKTLAEVPCAPSSASAISPDGRSLIYRNPDDEWIRYDLAAGEPQTRLHGDNGRPAFSPDGRLLAITQGDYVRVWDADSGTIVNALSASGSVRSLSFSADGQFLVAAVGDSAWLWAALPGAAPRQIGLPISQEEDEYRPPILSAALSPDNALLAVGDSQKTIWLYTSGGRLVRKLDGHTNAVRHLRFSPDGKRLLSGDEDGTLLLWDMATGQQLAANNDHTGTIGGLAFRNDGKLAAWQGGAAWTIHPDDGRLLHTTHIYSGTILAASPAGDWLATYYPYRVSLWDAHTGEYERTLAEEATEEVYGWYNDVYVARGFDGAAFSANGGRLATYGSGSLWVYDTFTFTAVISETGLPNTEQVIFSPDQQWLAVNTAFRSYPPGIYPLLPDDTSWALNYEYTYPQLAFSQDQRWLGALAQNGYPAVFTLQLWNTTTHELEHEIPFSDTVSLNALAFHPDSTLAAVGRDDGQIALVDLTTFEIVTTFAAHPGSVEHLAFSPDGSRLVSSGEEGIIRFWQLTDANP